MENIMDNKPVIKYEETKPMTPDDLGTVITTNPPIYIPSKNEQKKIEDCKKKKAAGTTD